MEEWPAHSWTPWATAPSRGNTLTLLTLAHSLAPLSMQDMPKERPKPLKEFTNDYLTFSYYWHSGEIGWSRKTLWQKWSRKASAVRRVNNPLNVLAIVSISMQINTQIIACSSKWRWETSAFSAKLNEVCKRFEFNCRFQCTLHSRCSQRGLGVLSHLLRRLALL